jgi:hypothetical protein
MAAGSKPSWVAGKFLRKLPADWFDLARERDHSPSVGFGKQRAAPRIALAGCVARKFVLRFL